MSAAPDSVVALNWRIPNNVKSSPSKILPMIRAMNFAGTTNKHCLFRYLLLFLSFFFSYFVLLLWFVCFVLFYYCYFFFWGGGGGAPLNPRRPWLSAAFEARNTKWAPRRLFEQMRYIKWLSLDWYPLLKVVVVLFCRSLSTENIMRVWNSDLSLLTR